MKTLTVLYWLRFALGITAAFVCIGYGIATGTIPTNLVANHSVETGATGTTTPQNWTRSANGAEWSTTYARTGSRSIEINVNNASAEWNSTAGPVTEGTTYETSGFFTGNVTAGQFFLTIRWFSDSGGTSFIAENDTAIPGNYSRWSPLGGDFTAPSGAKSCEIAFRAENGTGDVYGDDFEVRQTESYTKLMNGISLAIITYLVSYYVIKLRFAHKVEKPTKLFSTGIGIYFLTWLVFWILLYTLISVYL
jgi:hypothetical protein